MKLDDLLQPTNDTPKTVVVPMANDSDVIRCIAHAMEMKIANFILIGEEKKIKAIAKENSVDVSTAQFIHETEEQPACQKAASLVADGIAQILMKGLVQTSTFSKAFLNKEFKLVPQGQLISHIALFEIPTYHKLLIVTDAALNIAPDLEGKAKILNNALDFASKLNIAQPKVACIAAVEKVKPKIQSTIDADALKQMNKQGKFKDAIVDGPFALDVAVSQKAAKIKGITSSVAGNPDILLMPGLDAANVLYKCLTKLSNARAASVIAGLKAPVVLTSRADAEESKLLSLALATRLC